MEKVHTDWILLRKIFLGTVRGENFILRNREKCFDGNPYFEEAGKSIWMAGLVLRKLEKCFGENPYFKEVGKIMKTAFLIVAKCEKS